MHRTARFFLIQTVALWLCLAFICLLCSGFTQGEVIASRALEHLEKPYVLGAEGPDEFDCSGLVMYMLQPEGFEFPIHAAALIGTDERYLYIAEPRQLLTGDIVCFDTIQDRDPSDHMGIYLGGNQFVHASSTGKVIVSTLEDYYLEKFSGARRYLQAYYYLPTGAQIREAVESLGIGKWLEEKGVPQWFEGTGIPAWFKKLPQWFEDTGVPAWFRGIPQWFEETGIPAWFEGTGIPQWIRGLDLPGKFNVVKGKIAEQWNGIFGIS